MRKNKFLLTKPDIDWLLDSMKRVFPTKEEFDKKVDKVNEKLERFPTFLSTCGKIVNKT